MSHLTFKDYPGLGETLKKTYYYSQAVRVGDFVYLSGQGGWDPNATQLEWKEGVAAQVAQAFENVKLALEQVGASMDHVFDFTSYTVPHGPESQEAIIKAVRHHCPNHAPLWTDIGVKSLAVPEMLVEIKVTAHIPPSASQ